MKRILLSIFFLTLSYFSFAVTYFYNGTAGGLATNTNWGINADGSGASPANFISGDIFVICNTTNQTTPTTDGSITLSTSWTVSGTGSKIVIGNGVGQVRLNINTGAILTATVDIVNNTDVSAFASAAPYANSNRLIFNDVDATYSGVLIGALTTISVVSYNYAGSQTILSGIYGNLLVGNLGTKTLSSGTATINNRFAINDNCTMVTSGTATLAGTFTTSLNGTASTTLLKIQATGNTLITTGRTYAFRVEYNSTSAQTLMPGIYSERLIISGDRGTNIVDCVAGGTYDFTLLVSNLPANQDIVDHTATYTAPGKLNTGTSTFRYSGSDNQKVTVNNISYYNLTLANNNLKSAASNITVTNLLSIEDNASCGNPINYNYTGYLQYRFAGTKHRRQGCNIEFPRELIASPTTPIKIIMDHTLMLIDDPDGLPCRFVDSDLQLIGGEVRLITPYTTLGGVYLPVSRLELLKNFSCGGGEFISGSTNSVIHISGSNNQSIGKIATNGSLKLDHQNGGVVTFVSDVACGNLRMFTPNVGNAGGIYTFGPSGTLMVNGNAILGKGTLQLNNSANATGVYHSHNITGDLTLRLDTVNTSDAPIIDFSSQNVGTLESVILNVGGNFNRTSGTMIASNASTTVAGRVNFNGTAQNLFNTTAGSTNTEVNFHVVSPSVSTLTNSFDINSAGETLEVETGGTLVFDATRLATGGTFKLNSGTVRTANLSGVNSSGPTGSVQTTTRFFSSGGSLEYNGTAAQNSGVFTTTPSALTINNLKINNSGTAPVLVTAQQNFTVNGTYTGTLGVFDVTGRTLTLVGDIANSGTGTVRGGGTANLVIFGLGAISGSLRFDQTTPGKSAGTGPTDITPLSIGTTNRFNNLTVDRAGNGTFTLVNEMQITNTVTPASGTLASAGNLVMLSTSSITASILSLDSGSVYIPPYIVPPTGNVIQEQWNGISGTNIGSIPTSTAPTSTSIITTLEIPSNSADNYGVRIRGYIIPTTTGDYTFYIASDDNSQLSLSTNNEPANLEVGIASVGSWTNSREWTRSPSQKSAVKSLTANTKYYFEALMKEGGGGDNLAIGWAGPGITSIAVIGSANIDRFPGSAPAPPPKVPSPASITGNVNVQSYFQGGSVDSNRGFRMISSPTNNPATFFSDLKNRFIITGQGATTNGFDIDPNLAPNAATIQTYNEPSTASAGSYVTLPGITTAMQVGKGYYFFFRGSREFLSTATNTKINSPFRAPENWIATHTGTVNQGPITSPTVTYSTGSTDGYVGLNLIGNPYPATLDFNAFLATNTVKIDDYLSIMNNVRTGYVTRSGGVTNGYFTTSPVAANGIEVVNPLRFIQPGQGFMIRNKSTISSTTLSFLESHKASAANSASARRLLSLNENGVSLTDNSGSNISKKTNEAPAERKLIRLSVDNGDVLRDDATIVLEEGNDASYGGYDAPYFSNGNLSCYTLTSDAKRAVINFMPAVSEVDSIKVAVNSNANYDNLKLSFTELTGLGDKQLLLKDKYLNKLTKISASTKSYNFAIDKAQKATFGTERFVLLFMDADALPAKVENLNADAVNSGVVLKWDTQTELDGAEFVVERSSDGINFDSIGIVDMVGNSSEVRAYKFVDDSPLNGTNIYRLRKVGKDGNITYTSTASAQFGLIAEGEEISVYPSNPTEILHISWKTNERVNIEIIDMMGRLVKSHRNVRAGLYRENVSGFATGMYVVKLYAYTNNRLMASAKFVKQ